MKKQKIYRHGEICFCEIDKLPEGLTETKTNEIMRGSGGNPHTFKGGKIYLKNVDTFVFGYFEADNTKLYHPGHSPSGCILPNGIYELRKQNEYINGELKIIVD